MTTRKKLITKFLAQPTSLSYPDIEHILSRLGFKKIGTKGSHKKFKHELLERDIIIPVHN